MKKILLYKFILYCFLAVSHNGFTQKKIKVTSEGISLSTDLTPKQALKEAIQEAKINALIEAGVSEHVGALRIMIQSETTNKLNQNFSEVISSDISADIVVDSIYPEQKEFHDEFGYMKVKVKIDATVYKYLDKRDPTFFYRVGNLKDIYFANESISFTFTPSRSGYLKIFALNESESLLVYPYKHPFANYLSDDANRFFNAGETVSFPLHDAYKPGYSIELKQGKLSESSILLFVFTKDNFTWVEEVTPQKIYNRIANIPPGKRAVKHFPIILKALKNKNHE